MKKNIKIILCSVFLLFIAAAAWRESFRTNDFFTGKETDILIIFLVSTAVIFITAFVNIPWLSLTLILAGAVTVNILSFRNAGVLVSPMAFMFAYKNAVKKNSDIWELVSVFLSIAAGLDLFAMLIYDLAKSNEIISELKTSAEYGGWAFMLIPLTALILLFCRSFQKPVTPPKNAKKKKPSDNSAEKFSSVYLIGIILCVLSLPLLWSFCYYHYIKICVWLWMLCASFSLFSDGQHKITDN